MANVNHSAPATAHAFAQTRTAFTTPGGARGTVYSLPQLGLALDVDVSRLPQCIRIVLESLLRHCTGQGDNQRVTPEHVRALARWQANAPRAQEIPFVVARVVLQDFTGVPLLADLAAMRDAAARLGRKPALIEPLVPVDLVVDHSIAIDHFGSKNALDLNMKIEFARNRERYQFIKWGMQAFNSFGVVPPGFGIVHQVNLEYLARGVHQTAEGVCYPDSLVGTDSHTTMVNGLGTVAWGVGGIEAEAAMLGQPVFLLTPDVVGVNLVGALREGVTATDLVLTVTELLRGHKVVGKFVEFFGDGTASLSLPDRATLANMAPEYGATLGFFPVDEKTLAYFKGTGRSTEQIELFEATFKAQGLFGVPRAGEIDYSQTITLDLAGIVPSLAGPKRPQDRIALNDVASRFEALYSAPLASGGYALKAGKFHQATRTAGGHDLSNGDVLIAAITSCTNTSNPGVMLAAGLLAKKAVLAGLKVPAHIKTSLAPGSRIVTDYLAKAGLLPYLEQLGFAVAAYGCTTCIGNAGDIAPELNAAIKEGDLVCAAVLSGNRTFEARIHPNLKANFLASPPLVLAYALAGTVTRDLMTQPVGWGHEGRAVYLGDIWPRADEIEALMALALDGAAYRANYAKVGAEPGALWQGIEGRSGATYDWPASSYIARPPFLDDFALIPKPVQPGVKGARILALLGDSITTDHISPAGSIDEASPAGQWLIAQGVRKADFNSYGARRGQHEVMLRGTFANVRVRNFVLPLAPDGSRTEGGFTLHQPGSKPMTIFDAAQRYQRDRVPTVVFAGEEYGTGSSRDWAAKGTLLLGVRAVVARSFERIHRANLVGMGVLPLQFKPGDAWDKLGLRGDETIAISLPAVVQPLCSAVMTITSAAGERRSCELVLRIDTPIEVAYWRHGGILPYVLRQLLA